MSWTIRTDGAGSPSGRTKKAGIARSAPGTSTRSSTTPAPPVTGAGQVWWHMVTSRTSLLRYRHPAMLPRILQDVVTTNAQPGDVRIAGPDRRSVAEKRAAVVRPG